MKQSLCIFCNKKIRAMISMKEPIYYLYLRVGDRTDTVSKAEHLREKGFKVVIIRESDGDSLITGFRQIIESCLYNNNMLK